MVWVGTVNMAVVKDEQQKQQLCGSEYFRMEFRVLQIKSVHLYSCTYLSDTGAGICILDSFSSDLCIIHCMFF